MLPAMSWWEIYVPFGRLDAGLRILLVIWIVTVVTAFGIWLYQRRHAGARR